MPTEHIINGDFSSGETGWNFSGSVVVGGTNSSDSALFSSNDTGTDGEISQTIAVTGGRTATLSFDYGKVGLAPGNVSGTWGVYDADTGALLAGGYISDSSGYSASSGRDTTDKNVTTTIDIPSGVASVRLVFTDTTSGSFSKDLDIDDVSFVTCFCEGTLIATPTGQVAVEDLQAGDFVMTREHGHQPLRRLLQTRVSKAQLDKNPKLRPVRIERGALGADLPTSDLLVSRQHRMLVSSKIVKRMLNIDAVLVPAIKLTALPGVSVDDDAEGVTYYHLLFDQHEVVFAQGAPSESFYPGPEALKAVSPEAFEEILTLFPDIAAKEFQLKLAYPSPSHDKQKQLVMRHAKNKRVLIAEPSICI
ncbi:Hint domain-containing protein [Roseovarius aestuarii]|nr:Hint domain-containing protein [Roseovarius aestuarii]